MKTELDGAKNILDFSEYGFPNFIRSSHLHKITERDAQVLAEEYHLKTIIDIHTSAKREEMPDMKELYRMLLTDVRCIRQIKKVMDIILSPEWCCPLALH